ncbi:MAG: SgcJ/EcaC family oxidoreductase [Pseudomonadota bacterium]|nr:SgcJ/EcaC family oxidoreductase [Pseudomonadota bacterium]
MRNGLTIAMLALALGGCDFRTAVTADNGSVTAASLTPPTAAEADKIVSEAYAAFTSGDAIAMMGHYAPGATVIDAANNAPSSDRATITKWSANFAAMKPSDLVTDPRTVQVLDADTIVSSGMAAFLADVGGNRRRVSVRYTHVFQRQPDGRWLIVAEHNSIPPQPVALGL